MMFDEFCGSGGWGFLGNFDVWDLIGWGLTLIVWVGLLVALTLLVVWIIRRARVSGGTVAYATTQPAASEILQARYARGEITREQFKTVSAKLTYRL
jgi:uncharacterized membrane protein